MSKLIPAKIKKLDGNFGFYNYKGNEHSCNLDLVKETKVGDLVLIHDDRAISKITEDEAKEY